MAKLADPLRAYRELHGMSQQWLADKLKVSRQLVSMLELGEREYTADMCVLIEEKIGVPREAMRPDLFKREAA